MDLTEGWSAPSVLSSKIALHRLVAVECYTATVQADNRRYLNCQRWQPEHLSEEILIKVSYNRRLDMGRSGLSLR